MIWIILSSVSKYDIMEFMGLRAFAQFTTGHTSKCTCKWCFQLKDIPAVKDDSNTAPSARSETALLEPKNFVRVPMIEG